MPRAGESDSQNEQTMSTVDYIEVTRTAYQLQKDHGRNAWQYAERLAHEAAAEGKAQAAEFWKAVAAAIAPRGVIAD